MERSEVVSESTCTACGVEVRHGSLFCYNCGGSVGNEMAVLEATSYSHNGPGMPAGNGASGSVSRNRRNRNSRRNRSNEPVQINWKRDEDPGVGFLVVAIVALLVALGLLAIAYYLH